MKLFTKNNKFTIYNDSCLKMLEDIECNSIDSIVTDPPYELGFMGKSWDSTGIAFQKETWQKCYEVLKPGGHLLAFGGSRTFYRIACAIEDAGFEIRDTIMWLYGSGFSKSMNLGKSIESKLINGSANTQSFKKLDGEKVAAGGWGMSQMAYQHGARPSNYDLDDHMRVTKVDYQTEEGLKWSTYGTALKPAFEPVIVARKPCEGSTTDNVLKWGVGGINIDECRVPFKGDMWSTQKSGKSSRAFQSEETTTADGLCEANPNGRFPANLILTYDDSDYEEVCGGFPEGGKNGSIAKPYKMNNQVYGDYGYCNTWDAYNDSGSASRYFYCAKATKRDREEGLEEFELSTSMCDRDPSLDSANVPQNRSNVPRRNHHPCVKPTTLMSYLVRLVTPKGGIVLDPFMGSGSTGKATMYENIDRNADYKFIGIELQEEYCEIAEARIKYAIKDNSLIEEVTTEKQKEKTTPTLQVEQLW